jgi:hypothetical protein
MESVEIAGVSSATLRSYNTELVSKLINLVSAACQVVKSILVILFILFFIKKHKLFLKLDFPILSTFGPFRRLTRLGYVLYI